MDWHYIERGQRLGPVNDAVLLEMEHSGKMTADMLVWRDGMADWKPFREVKGALKPAAPAVDPKEVIPKDAVKPGLIYCPPAVAGEPEAVCAECGKIFSVAKMSHQGEVRLCSTCKPVYQQKLSAGKATDTGGVRYAGFFIRLLAFFLDGLILGVAGAAILVAAVLMFAVQLRMQSPEEVNIKLIVLFDLGLMCMFILYSVFFLGRFGATPGKMICGLKVVTTDGSRLSYRRALARYFAQILSGMTLCIGYLMIFFDRERRAMHDHLCGTRVTRK